MIYLIIWFVVASIALLGANVLVLSLTAIFEYIEDKIESKCKNPAIVYVSMFAICAATIATTFFITDNYAKY